MIDSLLVSRRTIPLCRALHHLIQRLCRWVLRPVFLSVGQPLHRRPVNQHTDRMLHLRISSMIPSRWMDLLSHPMCGTMVSLVPRQSTNRPLSVAWMHTVRQCYIKLQGSSSRKCWYELLKRKCWYGFMFILSLVMNMSYVVMVLIFYVLSCLSIKAFYII